MRFLVIVPLLLGACDLKPPPKKQAPAAEPAAPPQPGPAAAPATPPPTAAQGSGAPGAPTPAPQPEVSQPCLDVSAHIASVMIAETTDPSQRASLEQEKTKIIRRSAEACTRDAWPDAARACFQQATTVPALQECGKQLKAP